MGALVEGGERACGLASGFGGLLGERVGGWVDGRASWRAGKRVGRRAGERAASLPFVSSCSCLAIGAPSPPPSRLRAPPSTLAPHHPTHPSTPKAPLTLATQWVPSLVPDAITFPTAVFGIASVTIAILIGCTPGFHVRNNLFCQVYGEPNFWV